MERIRAQEGGDRAMALATASADPAMAVRNLAAYLEAAGGLPPELPAAVTLFAGSQSMSDAVVRDPSILLAALTDRSRPDGEHLRDRVTACTLRFPEHPLRALRRFVREETLRLLLDDLTGRADLPEVASHLSRIADAAIDAALGIAIGEARERYGIPRDRSGDPISMTVIGLGKLGGEELNYSSDIDLLLLYSAEGRTEAPETRRARRARDFYRRVVDRVRGLLSEQTVDGHCYRVDLRLRPEGSTGALTRTVSSALEYYHRSGRTWERQAMIKARVVAGDRELGERGFLRPMADFIYGTPLTVESIQSIQHLKAEIERRNPDRREVKAGWGGIRDIEFTVQFLQLLNGREYPEVRTSGTLPALRRLQEVGALTAEERIALTQSYIFLRTVEHRLQTLHEVRTHLLPADQEGVRRLARRLNLGRGDLDAVEEFRALRSRHTVATRGVLTRLFRNLFEEGSQDAAVISNFVLHPEGYGTPFVTWLGENGFAEPETSAGTMRVLASCPQPRARKFLASLAPRLLARMITTPEPDRCIRNLERLVTSYGAPTGLYQWFSEVPDIMEVFTDLCGWSQHLAEKLIRNPTMIDAFLDALVVAPEGGSQPWDDLPLDAIVGAEDPSGTLEDLKDLSLLRIGVRDIQRKANTENTATELTALAERILRLALRIARGETTARQGALDPRARLAVLGLGRLGAREMNYASDLDLLFVMEVPANDPASAGSREHLERLARNLLRLLTETGGRGRLYEVDPRVRPYGRSGPLLITLESFVRYYTEEAKVAELQMLTKARPVAGDEELRESVARAVEVILYADRPREDIRNEVLRMRRRLEESSAELDVKRGFGGIADIEFLVEALKLLHGHRIPELRTTGTIAGLSTAMRSGLVGFREYESLLTAIQFFRSIESRMRIVYDMAQASIPKSEVERNRLARRLGYVDTPHSLAGDSLIGEYEYHTQRTREVFLELLSRE